MDSQNSTFGQPYSEEDIKKLFGDLKHAAEEKETWADKMKREINKIEKYADKNK